MVTVESEGNPAGMGVLESGRLAGWRIGLDCVLAVVGVGVAVWRLAPTLAAVRDLGGQVAGTRWGWLGVAVGLGTSSLVLYGVLHRRLLVAGGAWLPARTVQAVTFVQNALTQSLPSAGSVASLAYACAAFRRRGVETTLAVWSVVLAGAISLVTLLVIAPLLLAGDGLLTVPAGLGLCGGLALLAWVGWRLVQRPWALGGIARGAVALVRHVPLVRNAQWVMHPEAAAVEFAARVVRLHPRPGQWIGFVAVALAGLVVDYLALACCVAATVGFVPCVGGCRVSGGAGQHRAAIDPGWRWPGRDWPVGGAGGRGSSSGAGRGCGCGVSSDYLARSGGCRLGDLFVSR